MFFTSLGAVTWAAGAVAPAGVTSFLSVVAGATISVFTSAAETSFTSADK